MLSVTPYNLDLTASDRANYVESKSHTMIRSANGTQLLLLDCGCFYEKGLILVDAATNQTILPSQYRFGGFMKAVSDISADRAWQYMILTDTALSSTVKVTCQAVGGIYSMTSKTLKAALDDLDTTTDPVSWVDDVTDKPLLYTPDIHDEYGFQMYGLEYLTDELLKNREAIRKGDRAMWDDAYNRINDIKEILLAIDKATEDGLTEHIADMNNPHMNTHGQIGAFGKAELDTFREQLVLQAYNAIYVALVNTGTPNVNALTNTLTAHINTSGTVPHSLTRTQVGAAAASEADQLPNLSGQYGVNLATLMGNFVKRDGDSYMNNGGFGYFGDRYNTAFFYTRVESNGFVVIGMCLGNQYDSGDADSGNCFRIELNTGSYTLYFYLINTEILRMTSADRIMKISDIEALIAQANCKCACDW